MGILLATVALCLGYKIYIDGDKEIGLLASIGRIIGMLAMIIALLGFACSICKMAKYGKAGLYCPSGGKTAALSYSGCAFK